jgi:hypothetical protein
LRGAVLRDNPVLVLHDEVCRCPPIGGRMPVAEVAMPRRTSHSGTGDESRAPAESSTITSAARVIGSAVGKVVAGTGRLLQRNAQSEPDQRSQANQKSQRGQKSQPNEKTASSASPPSEEAGKREGAARSSARRRQPTAAAKKKSARKKSGSKARPGTRRKSP